MLNPASIKSYNKMTMLGKMASLTEYPKKLQNWDAAQSHAGSPMSTFIWMASLDYLDAHLKIAEPNCGYPIGSKLPQSIGCKNLICCQVSQLRLYSPQRVESIYFPLVHFLVNCMNMVQNCSKLRYVNASIHKSISFLETIFKVKLHQAIKLCHNPISQLPPWYNLLQRVSRG